MRTASFEETDYIERVLDATLLVARGLDFLPATQAAFFNQQLFELFQTARALEQFFFARDLSDFPDYMALLNLQSETDTREIALLSQYLNLSDDQVFDYFRAPDSLVGLDQSLSLTSLFDVSTGTPDGIFGTEVSEALAGTADAETLDGLGGDDRIEGLGGDDVIDGGEGQDTAVFSGSQADYTLVLQGGLTQIADRRADGNGTDTLTNIEFLDFDQNLFDTPFSLEQFTGATQLSESDYRTFIELYIAYFNRAPDAVGLNFWATSFASGVSLAEIANLFIDQEETRASYPDTLTTDALVSTVYNNVLGRIPDQLGFDFWVDTLNSGAVGQDQFILEVLRGAKAAPPADATAAFVAQVQADQQFLESKIDIGVYFAINRGMSDVDNARAAMGLFDGTAESIQTSVVAMDGYYVDASSTGSGEFLMQLVGVLDDPFA